VWQVWKRPSFGRRTGGCGTGVNRSDDGTHLTISNGRAQAARYSSGCGSASTPALFVCQLSHRVYRRAEWTAASSPTRLVHAVDFASTTPRPELRPIGRCLNSAQVATIPGASRIAFETARPIDRGAYREGSYTNSLTSATWLEETTRGQPIQVKNQRKQSTERHTS
jgi:hypothetical protein